MPRYYFNLENSERDPDDEGSVLSDPNAARIEAVVFAGDYLSDHPELIWDGNHMRVEVADESGKILLRVDITTSVPAD